MIYSPACIFSFLITALVRGELADAWKWSDVPEEKKPDPIARRAASAGATPYLGTAKGTDVYNSAMHMAPDVKKQI